MERSLADTHSEKQKKLSRRLKSAVMFFAGRGLLLATLSAFLFLGLLEPLNLRLMDLRFSLLKRNPSDTLVIVAIDPKSLAQEDRWPWPRDRYAKAIVNLQDAGASLIAFDVDFSSLSYGSGDGALISALSRRPGDVILPAFAQQIGHGERSGEIVQTPPHRAFLRDVVVASANLATEKNGLVRKGWRGFRDGEAIRGSIAAVLAEAPGAQHESFYIDYGIDGSKITRLSFSDVLKGDFPADVVSGKKILIGATALELGDEFAAPNLGITPGVVFHALSYESLRQQRDLMRFQQYVPLALSFALALWLCHGGKYRKLKKGAVIHGVLFVVLLGGPIVLQAATAISFDSGALIAAQILSVIYVAIVKMHHYARLVLKQRGVTARYQALTGLVVRDNSDGVIVANAQGVIELCNERARSLLDASGEMRRGANILDFADDFPLYPVDDEAMLKDPTDIVEDPPVHVEYIPKSGEGRVLELVASRSVRKSQIGGWRNEAGRQQVFVYTLRDISARKRMEEAEKSALQSAIDANNLKSELISNMNHELRTPLNGVIGFADILRKESFGPIGLPEYKEYSENIYESGRRLLGLVNDMMNIAKLDANSYELCKEWMSLEEVIEDSLCAFESYKSFNKNMVDVRVQESMPPVNVDPGVIKEILSHLLSNAVKYAGGEAHIVIQAVCRGGEVILEIEDNGCGVKREYLPRLTEAFYQGESALNRNHEGAGLGLYLVSKFVSLHGGMIEFESDEGVGFLARATFSKLAAETDSVAA